MVRLLLLLGAAVTTLSCASAQPPVASPVTEGILSATGAAARIQAPGLAELPSAVDLRDGLSSDEAVATALWNNATFQVTLSQLGFARADLVDAGLLTNPVLSLLFPLGPKQFEATLRWPIEVLWERPKRRAAAQLALNAIASSLVQSGLDLALAVRVSHADYALAIDRQRLATDAAAILERIDVLTQSRLAAGDISTLEARVARVDAARARQDADRAAHDVRLARERLRLLLGLAADDPAVDRIQALAVPDACGTATDLLPRALAARPDVRAAEIAVEGAAARLGWERSRVLALAAVLDANGQGLEGFEAGPGVDVGLPIFNWNQGGRLRAATELQRASAAYVATQQQVGLDVREAVTLLDQAKESRTAWRTTLVVPLEANLTDAEEAYRAGDSSFLFVLENSRRLIEARLRERELAADEARAVARIERAIGAKCAPPAGETR
ncbi:TolC family protein [Luteitalea sp.]|uniref:TolC family protein n=1 Tax=Luteitalea sp. TaxID=2004800 RepID=UPI0025BB70D0|nr:TolC family protein [Luteitalea sp.]